MSAPTHNGPYRNASDQERGYEMTDPSAPTATTQRLSGYRDSIATFQERLHTLRSRLPSGTSLCNWVSGVCTWTLVGGAVATVLAAIGALSYGFHLADMKLKQKACRNEDKNREEDLANAWRGGRQQCENEVLEIYKHPQTVTTTETQFITVTPTSTATSTAQPKLLARCWTEDGCEEGKEAETLLLALMDHEGLSAAQAVAKFGEMLNSLEAAVSDPTITASPVPTTFATSSPMPSAAA